MHKLIALDNPTSKGHDEMNKIRDFQFYGGCFYFGTIQSSRVKEIIVNDLVMTVTTKNSVYKFRKD